MLIAEEFLLLSLDDDSGRLTIRNDKPKPPPPAHPGGPRWQR